MIYYRGTQNDPNWSLAGRSRFAYYTGAKPDPLKIERVPPLLQQLYNQGKIKEIQYPNTVDWSIRRTYSGMSNFGYGIYFSNSLDWARRYGNYIVAVDIPDQFIYFVNWEERKIPGTSANQLMSYVIKNAGEEFLNYKEQMPFFSKFCRNKKKKALFVKGDNDEGQLVVYNKDLIWHPLCLAIFHEINESFKQWLVN